MVRALLLAAAVLGAAGRAQAEVVDSSAHGFTIRQVATVAAHPSRVYQVSVDLLSRWWHPDHTFSGSAANLVLEATPGGCFCERFANGGGVVHLTVLYAAPSREIRFAGGLGPLQQMGVSGRLTWKLTDAAGRTEVEWTYAVGGYLPGGLASLAPPVDGVLGVQLQRLKRLVETGRPE